MRRIKNQLNCKDILEVKTLKNKLKLSQIQKYVLLIFIYFVVASASFQGYFSRWGFYNGSAWSIDGIFDQTAFKPMVNRQLIPEIAKAIDQKAPPIVKQKVSEQFLLHIDRVYKMKKSLNSIYTFRYFIVYVISFFCLMISMFLLRKLCINITKDSASSTLAPICLALSFPLFQNRGGYFYDYSELMFFALVMLLAYHKKLLWIILLLPIATLNKESFPLFVITLIPIIKNLVSRKRLVIFIFFSTLISIIVDVFISNHYKGSQSIYPMFYRFLENLKFYPNPFNYLFLEYHPFYSVIAPAGLSIFFIFIVYTIVSKSWSSLSTPIKQHTLIALLITIPLMILFCNKDELRNLSLLYVSFTIMIAFYIKNLLQQNNNRMEN